MTDELNKLADEILAMDANDSVEVHRVSGPPLLDLDVADLKTLVREWREMKARSTVRKVAECEICHGVMHGQIICANCG